MSASLGLRFRLRHGDGRQDILLVDAERALVGSAAHCEVRLDPEIVAPEHLEVVASNGTVQFKTKAVALGFGARPPLLDGVLLVEGRWPKESVLAIGNVQLQVESVDLAPARTRPPWEFLALVPVALLALAIALAPSMRPREEPIPDAPPLFAKNTMVCPTVAPEQRTALAAERLRIALAKRERSPFAPQDGMEAVQLFDAAAACFRVAGDPAEADRSNQMAEALRQKLDEDYRMRRLRLEHSYRLDDAPAAKRDLAVLIPMTAHLRDPYTEWLALVNRAMDAKLKAKRRI